MTRPLFRRHLGGGVEEAVDHGRDLCGRELDVLLPVLGECHTAVSAGQGAHVTRVRRTVKTSHVLKHLRTLLVLLSDTVGLVTSVGVSLSVYVLRQSSIHKHSMVGCH